MTLDQPGHNFRRGYDNRAGHGTSRRTTAKQVATCPS
jgi:hypothetical protein